MKQSKFLSLKEFVVVLLLACVEAAIGLVVTMPFAANLQLVYFLAPGLAGLINGIIYVLIIKKCPKIGTQFSGLLINCIEIAFVSQPVLADLKADMGIVD